jgi:hypothetical protein
MSDETRDMVKNVVDWSVKILIAAVGFFATRTLIEGQAVQKELIENQMELQRSIYKIEADFTVIRDKVGELQTDVKEIRNNTPTPKTNRP